MRIEKNLLRDVCLLLIVVILAWPVYAGFWFATMPVQLLIQPFTGGKPPVVYLYPLLFAAEFRSGTESVLMFDRALSIPITFIGWSVVGFVSSRLLRERGRAMTLGLALMIVVFVGAVNAVFINATGVHLQVAVPRT